NTTPPVSSVTHPSAANPNGPLPTAPSRSSRTTRPRPWRRTVRLLHPHRPSVVTRSAGSTPGAPDPDAPEPRPPVSGPPVREGSPAAEGGAPVVHTPPAVATARRQRSRGRSGGTIQSKVATAERPGSRLSRAAGGPTGRQGDAGGGSAGGGGPGPTGTSGGGGGGAGGGWGGVGRGRLARRSRGG